MLYFVMHRDSGAFITTKTTEEDARAWIATQWERHGIAPDFYEVATLDDGACKYHHTGSRRGYMSRKNPAGEAEPYEGRFGRGYIVTRPRWDTTNYVYVDYYVMGEVK